MESQPIKSRIFQDLVKQGMNPIVAAGWVGNWDVETGGFNHMQELNPLAGKGGFGWGQWTGVRRREFLDYAKNNNLDPTSYEANLGYAIKEMQDGKYMPKGFNDIVARKARNPQEAAAMISNMAQRPAKQYAHLNKRMDSAGDVYTAANQDPAIQTNSGYQANPGQPTSTQIARANVGESGAGPQMPIPPQAPPLGNLPPQLDFTSGSMKGGLAGLANPGYKPGESIQSLMSFLLGSGLGGQRSRERIQ